MSNDLSVISAIKGLVFGAPAGVLILTPSTLAIGVWKFIPALVKGYKFLRRTNHIGRNLKVAIGVAFPFGAVTSVGLATCAAALYGLGAGFGKTISTGLGASVEKNCKDVEWLWKELEDLLVKAGDYEHKPLKEGDIPYDIRVLEGLRALVAGGVCGPIEMGMGLGLAIYRFFPAWWKLAKATLLGKKSYVREGSPVLGVTTFLIGTPILVVLIPTSALAGATCGLVDGFRHGYRKDLTAAVKSTWERFKDVRDATYDMLHGDPEKKKLKKTA